MGLEPTTTTLARWSSTTELRSLLSEDGRSLAGERGGCKNFLRGDEKNSRDRAEGSRGEGGESCPFPCAMESVGNCQGGGGVVGFRVQ